MSNVVDDTSRAIERIYQSFILRDVLGFVLPGSLSLLSIWYLINPSTADPSFIGWLTNRFKSSYDWGHVLAFLGASYLTAWILQSVHYGLIDWLFPISNDRKWRHRLIWPLYGLRFYVKAVSHLEQTRQENNDKTIYPPIEEWPSFVTRGALIPDEIRKHIKNRKEKYPPRFSESLSYFERASALMIMTGNIAISVALFLIAWQPGFWWTIGGILVLLLVYLEHWRLWYARNLRNEIYVAETIWEENEEETSGSEQPVE